MSTMNWHLPSTSIGIKSCAATAADFLQPLKGVQGGKWKLGTLYSRKGFPHGASGKEPACNAGDIRDTGSIPGSGRFLAGGYGNPLQYS